MKLIVGLGNPGPRYQATRHNVGFMAVDAIAHRHNFSSPLQKFHGEIMEGRLGGEKVWLLKPQTFMNRSGIAVSEMAHFYKIPLEDILVIHDELDLPLGKLRLKIGGGAGGHNGLKSIDGHLGKAYHRMRIGIAHPGNASQVTGHVLSDFYKDEQPVVEAMVEAVSQYIELWVKEDSAGLMNKIALAMQPFLPEKKAAAKKDEGADNGI
ncbi:MAG: aminoacyl-tRNA hydrolase [Rickettsiales bacterium]